MKNIPKYLVLCTLSVIFLAPLVYVIYTSLVPFEWVNKIAPLSEISLDNYKYLFENYPLGQWYLNSTIMTVTIVFGNLVTSLFAGFALAKIDFKGRKLMFGFILATLMVPFQLLITPLYIMVAKLGIHDTLISLIIPFLVNSLSIFMARQYYLSIPNDLLDAAKVDGLGYIKTFFKIVLPISIPIIITLIIFNFTSTWNSYLIPSTFISSTENFTLTIGLNTIKDANFIRPNLTMAGVLLQSIPILVIFAILQKYFIEGIASSGIKE